MNDTAERVDDVLAAAVEVARAAAVEVGGTDVGEFLRTEPGPEGTAAHAFAASLPGYVGWYWAVEVARVPGSDQVTVDEVVLLPGEGALLAPAWVPWSERVQRGDLSPGDLLTAVENDDRLVPSYLDSGDPDAEAVATEIGLGRVHVLSRDGRLDAAERWQGGDGGPDTPMARQAPATCGTCGFLLSLAGSLRAAFGVCGNEISPRDGAVVSVEYGCGAHSEAGVEVPPMNEPAAVVYDDGPEIEPR